MPKLLQIDEYLLAPEPQNTYLSRPIFGINQDGTKNEFRVVEERPLTIFLNSQEYCLINYIFIFGKRLEIFKLVLRYRFQGL